MEERKEHTAMLDLMLRPAFSVKDGIICHVNQAAEQFLIPTGVQIAPMILMGAEEYAEFTGGCLYLTLGMGEIQLGACVVRMDGCDIFMPEKAMEPSELRAMALAAKVLREPLAGIVTAAERIFPVVSSEENPTLSAHTAQANRRLYQMQRIICNMSDAAAYAQPDSGRMEYTEICGFLEEIFVKAADLVTHAGLTLRFALPREAIYTLADRERLERSVYNLLSNAMKYTPHGGTIQAELVCRNRRLYLSISDEGPGVDGQNIYTRFLRDPMIEDSRFGLGLGMVLVRSTAAAHGGAVLIDQPAGRGTRVTMTLSLRQPKTTQVRSPILRIDYAGERDHGLLELADVLPAELYSSENLK